ncbi:MAG: FmdB family zinc ribbon protein [Acidobacteriota bacterium]
MPLYEYECKKCGHRFEVIQKFSDPPRRACPRCKGRVEKLLSAPAIRFKGSGWYVTDYGNKAKDTDGSKSPAKEDKGKEAPSGTKKEQGKDKGPKKGSD